MRCSECYKAWRCIIACSEINTVLAAIDDELSGEEGR